MTHRASKSSIVRTDVWDSERIHARFLPVCVEWRGIADVLSKCGMPALCPLCIIHHTDRPFHSWIQNSGRETTSNALGCPRLVRTSLPARWTPRFNFCRLAARAKSVRPGGNYDKWFLFSPFFFSSLENLENFPAEGDSAHQLQWLDLYRLAKRKEQI